VAASGGAGQPPIHTLAPSVLVARAIEEYAFAQVSWAVAEAFAAERAARFVSMDVARHHIDEKLTDLRTLERELRQEAITNEILEIASGAQSSGGAP
jgi:F-type H+-transporting ATPase subunit gamma